MPNVLELENSMPVGKLGLVVHPSFAGKGDTINSYLALFRKDIHNDLVKNDPAFQGYQKDNYLIPFEIPRFGSGEAKAQFLQSTRGYDLYILVDVCNHSITYNMNGFENHMSPDDIYQDLKRIIAAVDGKAARINVIMPFLYEGRQHRRTSRESLDAANMLKELSNMGMSDFITFDAHDPRVMNSIPLSGFDNFMPPYQFIKALLTNEEDLIVDEDHMVVISPDEGAMERAIYFANVLGLNTGTFYKRRDYTRIINGKNPIVAHEFLGDNIDSKDVVIIDDMISSGGSMVDTARQLKEMNARRVFICTTFGLFTEGLGLFDEAYEKGYFDRLITTNLTYLPPEIYDRPYFIEADMCKFIASIIDFMNHDSSMANVMDNTQKMHAILENYNQRRGIDL